MYDYVNHLQKISPIVLDCARNCISYDKARRGLAGLVPARGRRAFLLPTRAAHARFQFTVRVYGERVEARRQRGRSGSRRLALVENAIHPRRTTTCRLIAATELILERARSGDRRVFSRARARGEGETNGARDRACDRASATLLGVSTRMGSAPPPLPLTTTTTRDESETGITSLRYVVRCCIIIA